MSHAGLLTGLKPSGPRQCGCHQTSYFFFIFFVVFCFVFFSILTETNTVRLGLNELFTVNREAGKKEGFDRSHKALHRLC